MTRPTRRLRTRLLVAMVSIAFGTLVVAALGAAAIAKQTASNSALDDLHDRAPELSTLVENLGDQIRNQPVTAAAANRLQDTIVQLLAASGTSVFTINDDGTVTQGASGLIGREPASGRGTSLLDLPEDLRLNDLDLVELVAGKKQDGVNGSRAYVATPLTPVGGTTPVVVVTQQVERRPLGRAGTFLLLTGGVALLAAALASAYLARLMTRPLAGMDAAGRIAAGDLSVRVETEGLRDDELADLTRSFNAMASELETARGHERAFLLSISHDLRTPLTSIKGYAEAIADGTVEGADARIRAAQVIEAESRRLERLVADLLDLARLDAHQFSLTPRPVDARAVVGEAVAGFQPSARDFGVSLRVSDGDAVPADLDPERLAQVVANLVENALKYATSTVE